jgi:preprotein translocase subunit SecG
MAFIIGLLTFVLVLICIALILLVLIQLPKKEAGIGVAFGGGATDALFGAGSGTVLTKATKYAAISFFVLALLVGILQNHFNSRRSTSTFQRAVEQQVQQGTTPAPTTPSPAGTAPAAAPTPLMSTTAANATNTAAPANATAAPAATK